MSAEAYHNVYYSSGTEEDEYLLQQQHQHQLQYHQEARQQIMPTTVAPKKKGKVTKKRKRVGRACVFCQRSHMSCDEQRPCKRCVARGCGDQCRDGKRKRRGRRPKGRLVAEEEVDDFEPGYNGELLHDHEHDENCAHDDDAHTHYVVSAIYDAAAQHTPYPNIRVVEADSDDEDEVDGDEEVEVDVDDSQQTAHFDARRALQAARFKQMRHGLLKAEPYGGAQAADEDSDDDSVTLGGISGRSSPALIDSSAGVIAAPELSAVKTEQQPQESEISVFPGLWEAVTTAAEQAAEDTDYSHLASASACGMISANTSNTANVPIKTENIDIDSFFQMDYLAQRPMYGGESFPADFDLVM